MSERFHGWTRLWREPLLHFLVLGALLFVAFHWRGAGGAGSNRIVITPGQIEAMSVQFAKTWQRPPTDEELKGLVDDHVREEIATREAMAMGLDRDDTIIRRRLRQKLEFLAEDSVDAVPPTDADLQAWLDAHPDDYRVEPVVSFRQVYVNADGRGAAADDEAVRLLARLKAGGPPIDIDALGDPLMLPREVDGATQADVARQFGEEFAEAVVGLDPGTWTGPIGSGYGLHLVFVRERRAAAAPALADVRMQVERDFTSDRRRKQLATMYDGLLTRYRVTIERPKEAQAGSASAAPSEARP